MRAAARNDLDVTSGWARAALSKRIFTGLQPRRLGRLIAELAGAWTAAEEARLHERRGHDRMRAPGAGPDHDLPFTDRVIVTLVHLRFQLPHAVLAALYRVDRSTVTRAVGEIRPLLAARGFAVPGHPDLRLRTLADVFAYAAGPGRGTADRRHRGPGPPPPREQARPAAFVSGKKKMNTKKATVVTDEQGRTLWAGAFRPGRMHDQTAVRTEGIADLFTQFPQVKAKVDAGYRGLAKEFPDQVQAPPLKPKKDAPAGGNRRLRGTAAPAVIGADLRRARQRRAQAMADPPALPRTTRGLRRDLHGHRRPGLRPRRRAVTHQPARQASTPQR